MHDLNNISNYLKSIYALIVKFVRNTNNEHNLNQLANQVDKFYKLICAPNYSEINF